MYLYNNSKFIIDLPTGETLYPYCMSSSITASQYTLPGMQEIIHSGWVIVLRSPNLRSVYPNALQPCFLKDISSSNEFPTKLQVKDGSFVTISTDVYDINPEKTNTGGFYEAGQTLIWYNGTWNPLSKCSSGPAPEYLDIYESCETSVDVYEVCTFTQLVDIYEVCDYTPPTPTVDTYETCT